MDNKERNEYIVSNWNKFTQLEIAKKIGISRTLVGKIGRGYGLKAKHIFKDESNDVDLDKLKLLYKTNSRTKVAKLLNVNEGVVRYLIHKHFLKKDGSNQTRIIQNNKSLIF